MLHFRRKSRGEGMIYHFESSHASVWQTQSRSKCYLSIKARQCLFIGLAANCEDN